MVEIDEKQGFSIIQKAKETGSVKIGVNEVTKSIERGQAKLVFYANDVSPKEIVAHLPGISKEMNIICVELGNKTELGSTVDIKATTAIAITDGGTAKAEIQKLNEENKKKSKETQDSKKEVKKEKDSKEGSKKEVKEEKVSKEDKTQESEK
ncbi:MAG: ribosomal L7Ae/L30e/S12e/Gadd45 family protein [Nanoarchaeota archaeon]